MSKLALVATIEVQPGSQKEVLLALLAHRERCLKEEPGTLQFEVLVPVEEPSKILLFELYTNSSAFSAHAEGPSIARFRKEVGANIINSTSFQCIPANELPS